MWNLYLISLFVISLLSILIYDHFWYKKFIKNTYGFMNNKNIKIGKDISRTKLIIIE